MLVLTSRMCAGLDAVGESNVRYAALFYVVATRERGRGGEGESRTEGREGGPMNYESNICLLVATLIQEFRASPGLEWFYPLNTVNLIMFWSQTVFDYPENPAAQCTVHRADQASRCQTTGCQKLVVNIVITSMFRGAQQSSGLPKAHMEAINGGQRYKHTMRSMDPCTGQIIKMGWTVELQSHEPQCD